ncbi:MAG: cadherin domain-containing protein, partial [Arenicellales bacterium]|nr:cadherin domain-containing protein [Arenicellales bacterium]
WRTTEESSSVVRYGDSPTNLTQTMTINDSATDHVVTLTGLAAATQYYYQIESSNLGGTITEGATADYYFKTYPTPGTQAPTRLWVIGDSGTGNSNQMNVYNAYRARTATAHTDAWLMLGDNAYKNGSDEEFQRAVFDVYPELLRNTTMWSCIGNHETYTSNGDPYIDIHSFPTAGECGGVASGSEHYYSYDHGNIHFVCLDSMTSNASDLPGSGGMVDWLESDLQATDKDWIIAYFHHGPYSKGSHDSDTEAQHIIVRRYMTPLLEAYGVDMVLSGHSHTYERSMLVNGHHSNMTADDSTSSTFNYRMHAIDNGNGSDLGSVDGSGQFVTDGGDGSYRKELGSTQSGTIYSICGASGKLNDWSGGYSDTVNPVPHPVFVVNLRALGSMIINVDGDILNAQYLDDQNVVRDDFTIVKPASGSVQAASVSEIAPVGTSVATVNASGSGTLDYSIIEGNEAAMFAIDSSTGEVTSLALFDFQMEKIYNLTIGVTDDEVAVDPVLVTVNVLIPLVAIDDSTITVEGFSTLLIEVLSNDLLGQGEALSITGFTQPANGVVVDNGDGTLTYTPNASYTVSDTFSYTASNGTGSDDAVVYIKTTQLADDLVAYYDFEDNLNDTSASPNVNDASIGGGAPTYITGRFAKSLSLDGVGDYVTLGSPTDLNFGTSTDFSVSFWYRTSAGQARDPVIISNKNWGSRKNPGWQVEAAAENGADDLGLQVGDGSAPVYGSAVDLNFDQWYFVAANFKRGQTMDLYADGVKKSSTDISGLTGTLDALATNIGQDGTGTYSDFTLMDIDDLAIWRRAITSAEVTKIFESGQQGTTLKQLIDLTNPNQAPEIADQSFDTAENVSNGTAVGTVVTTDADAGDTLSYVITAGNGDGEFAINSRTGAITTAAAIDYEMINQYTLTVTVSDSGLLTATASITVNITDVLGDDSDSDGLDDAWEITHFENTSSQAGNDDADGDGLNAFQEMVFGGDPTANDSGQQPAQSSIVDDNGTPKVKFRFRRPQNHAELGLIYEFQTCNDLKAASWVTSGSAPNKVVQEGSNEWLTYLVPVPTGAEAQIFFRYRVTIPE